MDRGGKGSHNGRGRADGDGEIGGAKRCRGLTA